MLGRLVGRQYGAAVQRDPALAARCDPQAPVGGDGDVVREERRRDVAGRARAQRVGDVDGDELRCARPERDAERAAAARHVAREVADAFAVHDATAGEVDRRDLAAARVGDEGVAPGDHRVARLGEAAKHAAHPHAIALAFDQRQLAELRVGADGEVARPALDRSRPLDRPQPLDDPAGGGGDDGDVALGVGRCKRERRRLALEALAARPQRGKREQPRGDELTPVHGPITSAPLAEVQ